VWCEQDSSEFRFGCRNGITSQEFSYVELTRFNMYPEEAQIKKIEIGYDGDGCLIGFKWYDRHGKIALQTEWDWI
jgi:hypothetical protein